MGVLEALSPRLNRVTSEYDSSPPSTAQIKNEWSYASTPQIRPHGVHTGYSILRMLLKSCKLLPQKCLSVTPGGTIMMYLYISHYRGHMNTFSLLMV